MVHRVVFLSWIATILLVGLVQATPSPLKSEAGVEVRKVSTDTQMIHWDNKRIFYTGRWDTGLGSNDTYPASWWATSGFKLHFTESIKGKGKGKGKGVKTGNAGTFKTLKLHLGPRTTENLTIGISFDYAAFISHNVSAGIADLSGLIPANLSSSLNSKSGSRSHVLRIAVENWQSNRLHLKAIEMDAALKLETYEPAKRMFQFIGDSLLSGQYDDQVGLSSWGWVAGEMLKAEHSSTAQPGACLAGGCWGNPAGMERNYWYTQDGGFSHEPAAPTNHTTRWAFERPPQNQQKPTHLVVQIGANDQGYWNTSAIVHAETYANFLRSLRLVHPVPIPIFVVDYWGWPQPKGPNQPIYPGVSEQVVQLRQEDGDMDVHYVPTGMEWVDWNDVLPANQHPSTAGSQKIATKFVSYLTQHFGIAPEAEWRTSV